MEPNAEQESATGRAIANAMRVLSSGTMALVPFAGGAVGAALTELTLIRLERAVELLTEVVEEVAAAQGRLAEDVIAESVQDPAVSGMLLQGVEALRSDDELQRRTAGRIIRGGLVDDATVDECRVLLSTMRQYEPMHLRVLAELTRPIDVGQGRTVPPSPLSEADLGLRWPEGATVMPAVLARLEATGAIRRVQLTSQQVSRDLAWNLSGSGGGSSFGGAELLWECTAFGRRLAEYAAAS